MTVSTGFRGLLREQKIIVCCGAGGVGKTTTAAATALAAARLGRRVLVLTIDPSKRLAETLGVSRNPPVPVALDPARLVAMGIAGPGSLDAWLLDPKLVSDDSVKRIIKDPAEQARFLSNRIYQQVSSMVAGMHEYTAMKALHQLVTEGKYDLVVLDTPPSRNALDFLDAPRRLARLLDGKVFQALLPRKGGLIARAASRLVDRISVTVFGPEFGAELTESIGTFSSLFLQLGGEVNAMRDLLSQPECAFVLVCSPAEETLAEVQFFREKSSELGLPFRGFVLNRSRAADDQRVLPGPELLPPDAGPDAKSGWTKLAVLARAEYAAAERDRRLLGALIERAGPDAVALAVPSLPAGADDVATLVAVADVLAGH